MKVTRVVIRNVMGLDELIMLAADDTATLTIEDMSEGAQKEI